MTQTLENLNLTEDTAPPGGFLARVGSHSETFSNNALRLDEKVAVREASLLTPHPDFVFFRRFADGRSSQVAAYVINNTDNHISADKLKDMHRHIWLSGHTPLLYVASTGRVDIYSCAAPALKNNSTDWQPEPADTIRDTADITDALTKRYSAFRLIDGTFWEDKDNARLISSNKTAQNELFEKVKNADKELNGQSNPAARHLLLLTLLLKYLEDRGVFPQGWFNQFIPDETSHSCLYVFKKGGKRAVLRMFEELEKRFNGDIFSISPEHEQTIDDALLRNLTDCICPNMDPGGQFWLWDHYSFKHIPVEVLSHIYQQFTEKGKGAVFTPPRLVDLLLDQAMPLKDLRGDEKIFDPTCGSGVFLVAAFRRLVNVWWDKHQKRPAPAELTGLLSKTIFGIEWQKQAAELTAFSLALAVCDALQPKVIYEKLQFKKIIGRNIFTGDYAELIDEVKEKTTRGKGFDIVVGNPPFITSGLTALMQERAKENDYDIPNKQTSYFFLMDCAKHALADMGKLCLLQNAGFLYNKNTGSLRNNFFNSIQVNGILDFASISGLFKNANTKVIAVLGTKKHPDNEYIIAHWTFRRTFAADCLLGYDLDYYDYHEVSAEDAITKETWPWRANLLGGGRLFHLASRLATFDTLQDAINKNGWCMGEGFIRAIKLESPATPEWMFGKPLLSAEAFTEDGINTKMLKKTVTFKTCNRPRNEWLYQAPLVLLKEHDSLPCTFLGEGFLVYPRAIIGIVSKIADKKRLQSFADRFVRDRSILQASCQLLGTRLLISRATAPTKAEIDRLPWPEDGNWNLAPWEEEMLEDVTQNMAEYVRLGQDSSILKNPLREKERNAYTDTFLRLVRKIFPKAADVGHGQENGLCYQAFRLKGDATLDWTEQNWAEYAKKIIFSKAGDAQSFCSIRLFRIYEGDIFILIKPDRPRYWLRSIAIRDIDDLLGDILREDSTNA